MGAPGTTPGPWSVPHFARPEVNCECKYVLCDHLMGAVATVYASGEGDDWQQHGDNPRFAEAVANAHQIAASGALYDALEGWDRLHTEMVDHGGDLAELPPHLIEQFAHVQRELMDRTRAALELARGTQQ